MQKALSTDTIKQLEYYNGSVCLIIHHFAVPFTNNMALCELSLIHLVLVNQWLDPGDAGLYQRDEVESSLQHLGEIGF